MVSPVTSSVPSGRISRWFRRLVLGALTAGVGTNGVYTYQQAQTNNKLNQELAERTVSIEELGKALDIEKEINGSQATQMSTLSEELQGSKANALNFLNKLDQEHLRTSQLTEKLNALSSDLNKRITLDQITKAINIVKSSATMVETAHGNGSGVILFGANGGRYVLTNAHVTGGDEIRNNEFKDGVYHIILYNGSDYEKNKIEFDAPPVILSNGKRAHSKEHDLSLLAIPPDIKLAPGIGVKFRDIKTHKLEVGEPVIAIGTPFGNRDFVSLGILSHIDKEIIFAPSKNKPHIMFDASGAPGSSGGGLFTIRIENGEIIVELAGIIDGGFSDSLSGAIRVDTAEKALNEWNLELQKN